jgi:hypothetical protein
VSATAEHRCEKALHDRANRGRVYGNEVCVLYFLRMKQRDSNYSMGLAQMQSDCPTCKFVHPLLTPEFFEMMLAVVVPNFWEIAQQLSPATSIIVSATVDVCTFDAHPRQPCSAGCSRRCWEEPEPGHCHHHRARRGPGRCSGWCSRC